MRILFVCIKGGGVNKEEMLEVICSVDLICKREAFVFEFL
jgi:hypothetical protein